MTYKTKNWKRKKKDEKDTLYKTTCCKQSHWQSLLHIHSKHKGYDNSYRYR